MKRQTRYLNTDLELIAPQSLEALAAAFEARGLFSLHVDRRSDQQWHATFETGEQFSEPELNVVAFLATIEALDPKSRGLLADCSSRELDIGYECGEIPWAFSHGLTVPTLARMSALNISLRITLYPAEAAVAET